MLSDTLAWNRLPVRRRATAADSRVLEAILELLAKVPATDRHQESASGSVAREISRRAAAKAAVTAGSLEAGGSDGDRIVRGGCTWHVRYRRSSRPSNALDSASLPSSWMK